MEDPTIIVDRFKIIAVVDRPRCFSETDVSYYYFVSVVRYNIT